MRERFKYASIFSVIALVALTFSVVSYLDAFPPDEASRLVLLKRNVALAERRSGSRPYYRNTRNSMAVDKRDDEEASNSVDPDEPVIADNEKPSSPTSPSSATITSLSSSSPRPSKSSSLSHSVSPSSAKKTGGQAPVDDGFNGSGDPDEPEAPSGDPSETKDDLDGLFSDATTKSRSIGTNSWDNLFPDPTNTEDDYDPMTDPQALFTGTGTNGPSPKITGSIDDDIYYSYSGSTYGYATDEYDIYQPTGKYFTEGDFGYYGNDNLLPEETGSAGDYGYDEYYPESESGSPYHSGDYGYSNPKDYYNPYDDEEETNKSHKNGGGGTKSVSLAPPVTKTLNSPDELPSDGIVFVTVDWTESADSSSTTSTSSSPTVAYSKPTRAPGDIGPIVDCKRYGTGKKGITWDEFGKTIGNIQLNRTNAIYVEDKSCHQAWCDAEIGIRVRMCGDHVKDNYVSRTDATEFLGSFWDTSLKRLEKGQCENVEKIKDGNETYITGSFEYLPDQTNETDRVTIQIDKQDCIKWPTLGPSHRIAWNTSIDSIPQNQRAWHLFCENKTVSAEDEALSTNIEEVRLQLLKGFLPLSNTTTGEDDDIIGKMQYHCNDTSALVIAVAVEEDQRPGGFYISEALRYWQQSLTEPDSSLLMCNYYDENKQAIRPPGWGDVVDIQGRAVEMYKTDTQPFEPLGPGVSILKRKTDIDCTAFLDKMRTTGPAG